ncbi:MAG: hypothetical protein ABEH64_13740 [Salinirussus sp.]
MIGVDRLPSVARWLTALGRMVASLVDRVMNLILGRPDVDLHTRVTFRAVTDAVVPETPALEAERGPEHGPGGLEAGVDDFFVEYIDNGFQLGLPVVGPYGNIPLSDPIAHTLDLAAIALLDAGENDSPPRDRRPLEILDAGKGSERAVLDAAGTFAKLSRRDRLRAIGLLDEFEFAIEPFEDDLFEFDAGLMGQLVVGFTELLYYSEWQGYDDFDVPPSERKHDPAAVQSWRQTGFPGSADGYAALRGYMSSDGSPLGAGDTWTTVDADAEAPVRVTRQSGQFRENDYDTSGYEEPHPE